MSHRSEGSNPRAGMLDNALWHGSCPEGQTVFIYKCIEPEFAKRGIGAKSVWVEVFGSEFDRDTQKNSPAKRIGYYLEEKVLLLIYPL